MARIIGIDLGTTNSLVAVLEPDGPREAQGRAAERQDAAGDLDLAERRRARSDRDVRGQDQLDAQREAGALHRDDDGLADARPRDLPRVDAALADERQPVRPDARAEVSEVETGGEVVPLGAQHAHPQVRIAVQLGHGRSEVDHHLGHEGVLLRRVVYDHLQDAAVAFAADAALFGDVSGHACLLVCHSG